VEKNTGKVLGKAGFHGPPFNDVPTLEIGYSIDPEERRKGHARAVVGVLVETARQVEAVKRVGASVWTGNVASRRLVMGCGFVGMLFCL